LCVLEYNGDDWVGDRQANLYFQDDNPITTSAFFVNISSILIDRKIDIFSTACYGGLLHSKALDILPKGSTYVSLAPANEPVTGYNIDPFWDYLIKNKLSCVSAESMLITYLMTSLKNRYLPTLSTPKTTKDLDFLLTSCCKKKFSPQDRDYVVQQLSVFVENPNILNELMTKIENAYSASNFGIAEYGLALSICFAASGNMVLDIKKSKDHPKKEALQIPIYLPPQDYFQLLIGLKKAKEITKQDESIQEYFGKRP
jgi:hypothetical protein